MADEPEEALPEDEVEEQSEEEFIAALPAIEELTPESDFAAFLARRVPVTLRRAALRKLWQSDPVFANLDGLNDYDDDFRTLGVGKIVRTAYEVGKGFVKTVEKLAEDEEKPVETAEVPPPEENDETETEV